MIGQTLLAKIAGMAGVIDFGSKAAMLFVGRYKFMAEDPLKAHIAFGKLNIGIADARMSHLQNNFVIPGFGFRQFFFKADTSTAAVNTDHQFLLPGLLRSLITLL
jgi:hypothetical protein